MIIIHINETAIVRIIHGALDMLADRLLKSDIYRILIMYVIAIIAYSCLANVALCQTIGNPYNVYIHPDQCIYTLQDSIIVTVKSEHSDTLFMVPQLYSHRKGEWSIVIPDLLNYWEEPTEDVYHASVTLQPIPPGATYQFKVSLANIAASFPGELLLRLALRMWLPDVSTSLKRDILWGGNPFMLSEPTESEDSVLKSVVFKGWQRDTVFATYDPVVDAPVIPPDILVKKPYLLVLFDPFDTTEVAPSDKTRYKIIWQAPSIEGVLGLVITKRQIWLQSENNNPNPDELFWVTDITEEQYKEIELVLKNKYLQGFEEEIPEYGFVRHLYWHNHTPEVVPSEGWAERRAVRKEFRDKMYLNAKKLIAVINSRLKAGIRVEFPSRLEFDQIPVVNWEHTLGR